MSKRDLYNGATYGNYSISGHPFTSETLRQANIKLVLSALDGLNDSQFLAYLAMNIDNQGDSPESRYIAERLDKIALLLTAYESLEGGEHGVQTT